MPQKLISQQFEVLFNYDIIFSHAVFEPTNLTLIDIINKEPFAQQPKIGIIVDEGVTSNSPKLLETIIHYFSFHQQLSVTNNILVIPGGEGIKNNPVYVEQVLGLINNNKIDRHSFLIAIGGGALLDAVGYAAAIAHRGIRLIRIPTTVLSQNDSGVGVKNSINYFGKKNFLGTFSPPFAVVNDAIFLTTLSKRDWRSGMSEAVKIALIKDAQFFDWIIANVDALNSRNLPVMEKLIFRCAQLHTEHISSNGDPFEKGSSRPLDFGHWAAHKLEQLTDYEVTHGEAVAIGISLDATYSYLFGNIDSESLQRILNCFLGLGFAIIHPIFISRPNELLEGLEEFREHLGGQLTVMLLNEIGKGIEVHALDGNLITASINYLHEFQNSTLISV